jgi:hypothetical protein
MTTANLGEKQAQRRFPIDGASNQRCQRPFSWWSHQQGALNTDIQSTLRLCISRRTRGESCLPEERYRTRVPLPSAHPHAAAFGELNPPDPGGPQLGLAVSPPTRRAANAQADTSPEPTARHRRQPATAPACFPTLGRSRPQSESPLSTPAVMTPNNRHLRDPPTSIKPMDSARGAVAQTLNRSKPPPWTIAIRAIPTAFPIRRSLLRGRSCFG